MGVILQRRSRAHILECYDRVTLHSMSDVVLQAIQNIEHPTATQCRFVNQF